MAAKSNRLQPVKREDYELKFGGNVGDENFNPSDFYAPQIAGFKKFAVGPFFWFVVNAELGIAIDAGGHLERMMPFAFKEFVNNSPEILFRNCHPEDLPQMFAFTNHWLGFFLMLSPERRPHVRPTIYIRLLNQSAIYFWAMVQYAEPVVNGKDQVAFGLTFVTDISHIKKDGIAMMSMLDTYDDSCQHFFCTDNQTARDENVFLPKITPREIEVLQLLAIGQSSKQIAGELNAAVKTIDNHRQNMLRKTGSKSTAELVSFAIRSGFLGLNL